MVSKRSFCVPYQNLEKAYRIWMTVGDSPFTAALASAILNAPTPTHMSGVLHQLRAGGVIEDVNGSRISHYSRANGGATKWRFTDSFRRWAREREA